MNNGKTHRITKPSSLIQNLNNSKMMCSGFGVFFPGALHLYGAVYMTDIMACFQFHPLAQYGRPLLRIPLLTLCLEDLPSTVSCTGITFQPLNATNKHVPLATECQYPSTKSPSRLSFYQEKHQVHTIIPSAIFISFWKWDMVRYHLAQHSHSQWHITDQPLN